jgi:hypothetical protein
MKVGQKSVVRWVSKLVAGGANARQKQPVAHLRVLDATQVRHVSGGDGGSTQLPNKGW